MLEGGAFTRHMRSMALPFLMANCEVVVLDNLEPYSMPYS